MHLETARLPPRQPAVEAARERLLRLRTGERFLELLGKRRPRSEDECLERALRHLQDFRDLSVRTPLELAHHECRPLSRRKLLQRADDVGKAWTGALGNRLRELLVILDLDGLAVRSE